MQFDAATLASIKSWLATISVIQLTPAGEDTDSLNKAGLLPFLRGDDGREWRFMVMRPNAARPGMPPPELQICKGTRLAFEKNSWRDIRKHDSFCAFEALEPLEETALREGIEELGVRLEGIKALYNGGNVTFTSASTGLPKQMRLLLAEMKDEDCFAPLHEVAATTAGRHWVTLPEFAWQGRKDHLHIVSDMAALLQRQT